MIANLHSIASSAISGIHPNEQITLYISIGVQNIRGEIKPIYLEPQVLMAQVQNYERTTLGKNLELEAKVAKRIYLDANGIYVPSSLVRQEERSGDIVELVDGSYWQATATVDDYRKSHWVCLKVELLTIAPNFTYSPWYKVSEV